MAIDLNALPAVGDATKVDDLSIVRSNLRAMAGVHGGVALWQGGYTWLMVDDVAAVDLPNEAYFEIDGTYLGFVQVYLEVFVVGANPGVATCTLDLYNVTDAAVVVGSSVTVTPATGGTSGKSGFFSLPTSVKRFKARILVSNAANPAGALVRVVAKGN